MRTLIVNEVILNLIHNPLYRCYIKSHTIYPLKNNNLSNFLFYILLLLPLSILFSSPEQQTLQKDRKIRLSIIYKNLLNLSDIKYITNIIKNPYTLSLLFANRKITKEGKMYLKDIIFNNLDIKSLENNKKFWHKVTPYLNTENINLIITNLPKIKIENQISIIDIIISKHCRTLNTPLLKKIYSRYYKYSNFLDIISKCYNKNLLKIYTTFLKRRKISFRTYLYLIDEYEFKDVKKYIYKIIKNLPYTYIQLILMRYPDIINHATKNLYTKFLYDTLYFKRSAPNIPVKKEYGSFPLHLLKNLIENIEYSKTIRQIVKLNTNFLTLFFLVKKYPHKIEYIYKENLKSEYFRYRLFVTFIELKNLSKFHTLKQFYKPYEVYSYIKKLRHYRIGIKKICRELQAFFEDTDKKLWVEICSFK